MPVTTLVTAQLTAGLSATTGPGEMPSTPPAATGAGVLSATGSEVPLTTRGEQQGAVGTLAAELGDSG